MPAGPDGAVYSYSSPELVPSANGGSASLELDESAFSDPAPNGTYTSSAVGVRTTRMKRFQKTPNLSMSTQEAHQERVSISD